jgi:hypothetical protein
MVLCGIILPHRTLQWFFAVQKMFLSSFSNNYNVGPVAYSDILGHVFLCNNE